MFGLAMRKTVIRRFKVSFVTWVPTKINFSTFLTTTMTVVLFVLRMGDDGKW